ETECGWAVVEEVGRSTGGGAVRTLVVRQVRGKTNHVRIGGREEVDERRIGKVRAGIACRRGCTWVTRCQVRNHNWQLIRSSIRTSVAEVRATTGGYVRQQVLLSECKFRTKSVLNRIDFIDVVLNLQILSTVSNI